MSNSFAGNTINGKWKPSKWFTMWAGMKNRCSRKGYNSKNYFEKGIRVHTDWVTFEGFSAWLKPQLESYKGDLKEVSLDRIDPSKNYCADNCRLLSNKENSLRGVLNGVKSLKVMYTVLDSGGGEFIYRGQKFLLSKVVE